MEDLVIVDILMSNSSTQTDKAKYKIQYMILLCIDQDRKKWDEPLLGVEAIEYANEEVRRRMTEAQK